MCCCSSRNNDGMVSFKVNRLLYYSSSSGRLTQKSMEYREKRVRGSAQRDLSCGFSRSKNEPLLQSKCINFGVAFHSIVRGAQNSLSGGKRRLSGGWLRPTTPSQCGQYPESIECTECI